MGGGEGRQRESGRGVKRKGEEGERGGGGGVHKGRRRKKKEGRKGKNNSQTVRVVGCKTDGRSEVREDSLEHRIRTRKTLNRTLLKDIP